MSKMPYPIHGNPSFQNTHFGETTNCVKTCGLKALFLKLAISNFSVPWDWMLCCLTLSSMFYDFFVVFVRKNVFMKITCSPRDPPSVSPAPPTPDISRTWTLNPQIALETKISNPPPCSKHNKFTKFLEGPTCEICKITKTMRARCQRDRFFLSLVRFFLPDVVFFYQVQFFLLG